MPHLYRRNGKKRTDLRRTDKLVTCGDSESSKGD